MTDIHEFCRIERERLQQENVILKLNYKDAMEHWEDLESELSEIRNQCQIKEGGCMTQEEILKLANQLGTVVDGRLTFSNKKLLNFAAALTAEKDARINAELRSQLEESMKRVYNSGSQVERLEAELEAVKDENEKTEQMYLGQLEGRNIIIKQLKAGLAAAFQAGRQSMHDQVMDELNKPFLVDKSLHERLKGLLTKPSPNQIRRMYD